MMYKLAPLGILTQTQDIVVRISDNVHIPCSDNNADYRAYIEWLAEGNTPLPADE